VVGLPLYVPQPSFANGAESRVSVLEASPESASVKSVREIEKLPSEVLVDPPPVAAVPLTVSAPPVGTAESSTNVIPLVAVLPALSAPVSV
jgi:hypothetical protein